MYRYFIYLNKLLSGATTSHPTNTVDCQYDLSGYYNDCVVYRGWLHPFPLKCLQALKTCERDHEPLTLQQQILGSCMIFCSSRESLIIMPSFLPRFCYRFYWLGIHATVSHLARGVVTRVLGNANSSWKFVWMCNTTLVLLYTSHCFRVGILLFVYILVAIFWCFTGDMSPHSSFKVQQLQMSLVLPIDIWSENIRLAALELVHSNPSHILNHNI